MADFNYDKYGAFFAFTSEQFEEQKDKTKDNSDYVSIQYGLVCPKSTYTEMLKDLEIFSNKRVQDRLDKEGLDNIILAELRNYEAFYTGDISDAFDVLKEYGATREQVKKIYKDNYDKYCD